MSANLFRRNDFAQSLFALYIVPTREPIYVRPLRAPLKPMTMREALRVFESTEPKGRK